MAGYDPKTHSLIAFHDRVAAFRDGADTPRDFLERCIGEIEAREDEIMAWAHVDFDGARKAADAAGARYRAGAPLSPVDGLPIGVKDLIETADMPTEYGSTLFAGHRPKQDAAVVHALREGGAAILGKTVTIAFGGGDPARTRNPHDTSRTPGGSSSGSAAAVGAPTIPAAIGTHARGSTIRPASFCGTYALKPTYGAINRQGVFSAADSMDHLGTFAGSLRDVWTIARHMARLAGGDPGHPGLYGGARPPAPRKPMRLIRLEMAGWAETGDATRAAFEEVVRQTRRGGRRNLREGRRSHHRRIRSAARRNAGTLARSLPFRDAMADAAISRPLSRRRAAEAQAGAARGGGADPGDLSRGAGPARPCQDPP